MTRCYLTLYFNIVVSQFPMVREFVKIDVTKFSLQLCVCYDGSIEAVVA